MNNLLEILQGQVIKPWSLSLHELDGVYTFTIKREIKEESEEAFIRALNDLFVLSPVVRGELQAKENQIKYLKQDLEAEEQENENLKLRLEERLKASELIEILRLVLRREEHES